MKNDIKLTTKEIDEFYDYLEKNPQELENCEKEWIKQSEELEKFIENYCRIYNLKRITFEKDVYSDKTVTYEEYQKFMKPIMDAYYLYRDSKNN